MNNNIILQDYHNRSIFDSNCIEFWAPITDIVIPNVAENRYWVSTFGNTWNTRTNRPIGLSMHKKGYIQFSLMTKDQKQVTRKLHRAIMMTFCYFPGCEYLEVNYKDSIRTHNELTNLEWVTPSENTIHAINHGYKQVFGHDYSVQLTDQDVFNILALKDKMGPTEIKKYLQLNYISLDLVVNILSGYSRIAAQNIYNSNII